MLIKKEYLKPKHGFIAQEVQTATFENHSSNNAFGGLGIRESKEGDSLENEMGKPRYESIHWTISKSSSTIIS